MHAALLRQAVSTILAWPLGGHERMAGEAAATTLMRAETGGVLGHASQEVRERLKDVLRSMAEYVQTPDYVGLLGGHWAPWGQAQHFMKPSGWPSKDALEFGENFIWNSVLAAVGAFRSNDTGQAKLRLGEALHALQDSFSPAHVKRVRNDAGIWVIKDIQDYNAQESKEHEKGDQQYRTGAGNETPFSGLGQATVLASTLLLAYFVQRCTGDEGEAARSRASLNELYLNAELS
jgi:hypothetical protein